MIKYLKLGAKAVDFFDYDGSPLSFRPLYSWELDDAFEKSIKDASFTTIHLIMKVKLASISLTDDIPISSEQDVKEYQHAVNLLDYWIVYHGIKDFQPEEFREPDENDVPKGFTLIQTRFRYVHEIATKILSTTKQPIAVVKDIIKSKEGKEVASIHYRFNVPLTSEQWEMTPLQHDFIILSNPTTQAELALAEGRENTAIKSGMTLGDAMKRLGVDINAINKRPGTDNKRKSRRLV